MFYGVIFVIARFVPDNFLAVAFDSGGVTTGPMTVPFIMALGVGISAIRNDKHAENDSFGLVALCSIGPVLAVLLLGLVYPAQGSYVAADVPHNFPDHASPEQDQSNTVQTNPKLLTLHMYYPDIRIQHRVVK